MENFLHHWALSLAVFIPLVGAALMMVIPRAREDLHKWIALLTSLVVFGVTILVACYFDYDDARLQFARERKTLPNFGPYEDYRAVIHVHAEDSDHTKGMHVPLAAVAMGARILEKHITLDYDVPDAQDCKVSCGPADFPDFVRQVRDVEAALGTGVKSPVASEAESLAWARKSLVAAVDIEEGAQITAEMLLAKRPGTGIAPADVGRVVGRRAAERIAQDTLVRWDQIR